jgi:hypothetical protein
MSGPSRESTIRSPAPATKITPSPLLRLNVLATKNSKKIRYIHRNPSPVQAVHEPRSHFGNSQKNIFKKWKKITAQIHALKSPQSTINSPQTHHDFTIKKHHIFTAHSQKSPQKPRKPVPEKKSQKQIPRR